MDWRHVHRSAMLLALAALLIFPLSAASAEGLPAALSSSGPWMSSLAQLGVGESSPMVGDAANLAALQPSCRFGVNGWGDQLRDFDVIGNFGAGLYFDYGANGGTQPAMAGAEYLSLVKVYQDRPDDPPDNIENPLLCDGTYTSYRFGPPLTDSPGGLGSIVSKNPGRLWIIGNEPDRRSTESLDICPQVYADAYHDAYHFIKSRDPSAQVAVAGLVQVSPGRLQYLDIVWDTYVRKYGTPMPVDVWNMHIYLISETSNGDAHIAVGTDPALRIPSSSDCSDPSSICSAEHDDLSLFAEQVVRMRTWMAAHGQRNKPLLLSEFGINLPYHYGGICSDTVCPADPPDNYGCFCDTNGETFHPQRVADYLRETMNYLLNARDANLGYPPDGDRLVQQWMWFSLETDVAGSASNLIQSDGSAYTVTAPGAAFGGFAATVPLMPNLLPVSAYARNQNSLDGVSPVTATLVAEVRNNGNAALTQPFSVTFYSDMAMINPIGSATVNGLGGCARTSATVDVPWSGRATGVHRFWVKVDSQSVISESSEADNTIQGLLLANAGQVYLPLAVRR